MQYETLAPELKAWLKDSIVDRGCSRDVVLQSLRAAGYQRKFARDAVDAAFSRLMSEVTRPATHHSPAPAVIETAAGATAAAAEGDAEVDDDADDADDSTQADEQDPTSMSTSAILAQSPNSIETSDRNVHIVLAVNAPRVILFSNLLSKEECEEMIELSRHKLARSSVVNSETGAYDIHPHRTSSGTHFQRGENELIRRIEKRIAELVSYPIEKGEPIQILHYQPGGEYKPHFDYFDPTYPGNDKVLAMGGQRVATLIMYLNDVDAGGSTVFPDIGIDVLPRQGNAVYFAYCTPDGQLDKRTLHGGSPVADGEKWIATKWLRQENYGGPGS
jgi:prolyl 4-hydroxylase